jgi:hypothetical protein
LLGRRWQRLISYGVTRAIIVEAPEISNAVSSEALIFIRRCLRIPCRCLRAHYLESHIDEFDFAILADPNTGLRSIDLSASDALLGG